jgi:hypothetical protein
VCAERRGAEPSGLAAPKFFFFVIFFFSCQQSAIPTQRTELAWRLRICMICGNWPCASLKAGIGDWPLKRKFVVCEFAKIYT